MLRDRGGFARTTGKYGVPLARSVEIDNSLAGLHFLGMEFTGGKKWEFVPVPDAEDHDEDGAVEELILRRGGCPALFGMVRRGPRGRLPAALVRFDATLERYSYGNTNHCRHCIHTSELDGVNKQLVIIDRTAYGFSDVEYFGRTIEQAVP